MRLVLTSDWSKIDFQVQTEDDSYDESDSYETMSDGLAELLGLSKVIIIGFISHQ